MAEYTIDTDANVFGIDMEHPHPWICRDDDGDYWAVFKNLNNNIEIHKSENNGVSWVNKKTLTDSDYTGTPFPMDGFCIINLKGQNKVYILMYKKAPERKAWGWVINTTTDVGIADLDGDAITTHDPIKVEARWDEFNNKLYMCCGLNGYYKTIRREILLNGNFEGGTSVTTLVYGGGRGYGYAVDSNGNFFINAMAVSGGSINGIQKAETSTIKTLGISNQIYDFANIVCDHQDKIVLGCVYSNGLHIFKVSNDLSTLEINNATYALGFTPSSCFVTIDGINDIYFVYTNTSDDEAYSIKYDISATSWGSPVKISSDNDGLLVCPELKAPLNDDKLLVTYQSIS